MSTMHQCKLERPGDFIAFKDARTGKRLGILSRGRNFGVWRSTQWPFEVKIPFPICFKTLKRALYRGPDHDCPFCGQTYNQLKTMTTDEGPKSLLDCSNCNKIYRPR